MTFCRPRALLSRSTRSTLALHARRSSSCAGVATSPDVGNRIRTGSRRQVGTGEHAGNIGRTPSIRRAVKKPVDIIRCGVYSGTMKTKTCSHCGKTKPLDEFSATRKWITRISWCKACRRKDAKAKYAKESPADRRKRRSQHVVDIYAQRARRVNRRCQIKGVPGNLTGDDMRSAFVEYGGLCWICGDKATEVDHFRPINGSSGGTNTRENIRPICYACNRKRDHAWHGPRVAEQEALLLKQLKRLFNQASPECSCSTGGDA